MAVLSLAELMAPATALVSPSPQAPARRDSPWWSPRAAAHNPGGTARTPPPPSPSLPASTVPHDALVHRDITMVGAQPHVPSARGDSPQPPGDATEDFSGDALSQEDGGSIPPRPPLPPAPLVAEGPERAMQPYGDGGDGIGAPGDGSLERQRKAVTFFHPASSSVGHPATPSPTEAAAPQPQGELSPTAPHGPAEPPAEPSREQLAGYGDAGKGSAEPSGDTAMSPAVWDVPSPSSPPAVGEVTLRAGTERLVEALEPVAEEGSTSFAPTAPQPTSHAALELGGAEHLLLPPTAPRQPPASPGPSGVPSLEDAPMAPGEEDASGEVKREEPPTPPGSATRSPWPSPTAPHPWVPEAPESPSAGPRFEPSTAALLEGPGGSPLLDADSGSGEEPGLEERELLAWAGAGNASQHGECSAAGLGCWGYLELMGTERNKLGGRRTSRLTHTPPPGRHSAVPTHGVKAEVWGGVCLSFYPNQFTHRGVSSNRDGLGADSGFFKGSQAINVSWESILLNI